VEFQSTCLREARRGGPGPSTIGWNFNPRAYVRHDIMTYDKEQPKVFQSTCLREARLLRCLMFSRFPHFNPRAYVRHDTADIPIQITPENFNPRAYVRHDSFTS